MAIGTPLEPGQTAAGLAVGGSSVYTTLCTLPADAIEVGGYTYICSV